jgi:tRNA pseudouridine55 synthase
MALLHEAALGLSGEQMQTPPSYSAKQIGGQRAYKAARRGEHIEIPAVRIHVDAFEITSFENNEAQFRIACSKGTYIRTLAHDLGQRVESGAYLKSLRRTQSNPFDVKNAWTVETLLEHLKKLSS